MNINIVSNDICIHFGTNLTFPFNQRDDSQTGNSPYRYEMSTDPMDVIGKSPSKKKKERKKKETSPGKRIHPTATLSYRGHCNMEFTKTISFNNMTRNF